MTSDGPCRNDHPNVRMNHVMNDRPKYVARRRPAELWPLDLGAEKCPLALLNAPWEKLLPEEFDRT